MPRRQKHPASCEQIRGEIAKLRPPRDTPVNPVGAIIRREERQPERSLVYDCCVARRVRMRVERPFLKPSFPTTVVQEVHAHFVHVVGALGRITFISFDKIRQTY